MMELPMHKSFKHFALAGAAMALAITPALAEAQDQASPEAGMPTGTGVPPTNAADTATTPPTNPDSAAPDTTGTPTAPPAAAPPLSQADRDAAIKAWPPETQAYYQSLGEERQRMFWALSDTDKVRLSKLPDAQKEVAWTQIESQVTPPRV
jgi:hypothetical protein